MVHTPAETNNKQFLDIARVIYEFIGVIKQLLTRPEKVCALRVRGAVNYSQHIHSQHHSHSFSLAERKRNQASGGMRRLLHLNSYCTLRRSQK
jgi:hypothetical protein